MCRLGGGTRFARSFSVRMHQLLNRTETSWMALQLLLAAQSGIHLTPDIRIRAQQTLILTAGTYSAILFQAEAASGDKPRIPASYQFETAGDVPPGMFFESYPCHKPGQENCPALASSDGIYLDGVPSAPGSFKVTIKASALNGETASREFTITVKPSRAETHKQK